MMDIELTEIVGGAAIVLLVIIGIVLRSIRSREPDIDGSDPDFDDDDVEDVGEPDERPAPRYTPSAAHGLGIGLPRTPTAVPTDWQTPEPATPAANHPPETPEPETATVPAVAPEGAERLVAPIDEIELLAARRRALRAGLIPPRRKRRRRLSPFVAVIVLGAVGGGAALVVMRDRTPSMPEDMMLPGGNVQAVVPPLHPDTTPTPTPTPSLPPTPSPANAIARIEAVSGNTQTAIAGTVVPSPVSILVTDAEGAPVSDVRIAFRVTAGEGHVAPAEAVTDARGRASAAWAVGGRAGTNILEAAASDYPGVVVQFRATGVPGPASAINVVDGDVPTGTAPTRRVTFRVEDSHGNPIANARIVVRVVSGGGTVRPASLTTEQTGTAETTWSIAPESDNRITAQLVGSDVSIEYEPPRFRVRSRTGIFAGGTHTCVLAAGGTFNCWGSNDQGQLGSGTAESSRAPRFASMAVGITHTCGLDSQGRATCWGANGNGQLGTGDRTSRSSPTTIRTTMYLTDIAAGFAHSCALADTGAALCWGAGGEGQIGDGTTSDRLVPATVGGGRAFIALTVGWRHTCALAPDNSAWCWGSNTAGQLGNGTAMPRATPTRVAGAHRFRMIAAGATLTCGITTAGQTYCWGQNMGGPRPELVDGGVRFRSVVTGAAHACGLTDSGEAYCWGRNNFGQLGIDVANDAIVPVQVAGGHRFASLSAGGSHTCGRTPLGQDFCWGYNVEGQLGDGTRIDRVAPARVITR